MRDNWPRAVAHRIGMGGLVDFTTTKVGQTLHVPCKRGDHVVDFSITGNMPPDFVAKKMMQAGWTVGSKIICPDCSRKKKAPAAAPAQEEMTMATEPLPAGVELPPPAVGPRASPAAGKAKRLVYMALEDHYDENAKGYRPGHSDKTIATACGISEAAVKQIREESYGPLGEPIDVREFREALAGCRTDINAGADAARQAVRTLELRLDALVKKNGWAE